MNSKEALEELQCVLVSNQATKRYSDIFKENLLRPIEKDLEVLEKIKKEAIIQEHYKKGYGRYYTVGIEEFFNKIKEWLEID